MRVSINSLIVWTHDNSSAWATKEIIEYLDATMLSLHIHKLST